MCGPLAAAQGSRGRWGAARYQVGRGVAYVVLGAVAGGGGQALSALGGPVVGALVSLLMAAALLGLAIRLWRGERGERGERGAGRPVRLGRRRPPLVARACRRLAPGPLGMGVLSGLLPCGLLWAALALAASTGEAVSGALVMAGFAGATGASLVVAGVVAALVRGRALAGRRVLAGVLVVGAAITAARPVGALMAESAVPPCHAPAEVR